MSEPAGKCSCVYPAEDSGCGKDPEWCSEYDHHTCLHGVSKINNRARCEWNYDDGTVDVMSDE